MCEAEEANALGPKIESVMKKTLDDIDIQERLLRQRKLVELDVSLFPQEICDIFKYHVDNEESSGYIQTDSIKFDTILKDTKYCSADYNKPKENKIFDNLKDLDKYIKPINSALF